MSRALMLLGGQGARSQCPGGEALAREALALQPGNARTSTPALP
ncbi:hypothetical protein ACTMU2_03975 [Cupriavidus basilensis]